MQIKVLMDRGVVHDVLRSKDCPEEIEVEIVHVDPDYRDYEALEEYTAKLREDPNLVSANYSTANFEAEVEEDDEEDELDNCQAGIYDCSTCPITGDCIREQTDSEECRRYVF